MAKQDPNEHIYVTAYRMLGEDEKGLPDIHSLMPWARDRLIMQGMAARKRHIERRIKRMSVPQVLKEAS